MFFVLKTTTLEAKNMLGVVMVKNQWANSPQFSSLAPYGTFQCLHVKYLINSGRFEYKFKVDGAPDVDKADQHYFNACLSARCLAPYMARITQKTLQYIFYCCVRVYLALPRNGSTCHNIIIQGFA